MVDLKRVVVPGLLGGLLLVLAACAANVATLPTPPPTPTASPEATSPDPGEPIRLASGHYQLVEFYAPT
jgi:hypothetical protein